MNTFNLIPVIFQNLIVYILIFSRIASLFSTFILFRRDFVNVRIIVALTSILSFYVLILQQPKPIFYDLYSIQMLMQLFFQVLIGFVTGIILNIIFEIITAFGQIVSTQVGFSMVTLIDPRFGAITPLTLFYTYVAMLIFLQLNGHLITIKLILDSFSSLPLDHYFLPKNLMELVKYSENIFYGSVILSIAIIVTMLLTNLTIAVMTRFAPQFNVFTIGINISIILGLVCIYVTFNLFVNHVVDIMQNGLTFLTNFIVKFK